MLICYDLKSITGALNIIYRIVKKFYRSGQVRSGQVRSGQVRSGQVRSGQVRSGQVGSGQVRSGQVRSGQVRSGQVRSGRVTPVTSWSLGHFLDFLSALHLTCFLTKGTVHALMPSLTALCLNFLQLF